MAAYVIAELEVTDPAGFEEYRQQVAPTIEQYGGRYLVRGGRVESLEGGWEPKRLVVVEFESLERAKQWYDSSEYREPMALRQRTANCRVILVEGT